MLISIQIMVKLINQVVKMKILGQLDALMKGLRYFQSLLKNIQIFKMSDSIIIWIFQAYFAESILSKTAFKSKECSSWDNFEVIIKVNSEFGIQFDH